MTDRGISYLPPGIQSELRMWASDELSDDEMYSITRLVERVWADGYYQGHMRGFQEGVDHRRRPNVNDVNQLRERIKQEREEPGDVR